MENLEEYDDTERVEDRNKELRYDHITREVKAIDREIANCRRKVIELAQQVQMSASACELNHSHGVLHGADQVEYTIAVLVRIGALEADIKRYSIQKEWMQNHILYHY